MRFKRYITYKKILSLFRSQNGSPFFNAKGLAIGVFSGCFPFFGFQTLMGVFFAKITTKILPKKKLKPKATPISPNVFALFSGLEISARIVVAVAAVHPLKPSINLAKNNKNNGIEAIEFDQLKSTVKDNMDIPITEPVIQKSVTGLLRR